MWWTLSGGIGVVSQGDEAKVYVAVVVSELGKGALQSQLVASTVAGLFNTIDAAE
jgi:hypothetical protein